MLFLAIARFIYQIRWVYYGVLQRNKGIRTVQMILLQIEVEITFLKGYLKPHCNKDNHWHGVKFLEMYFNVYL